MSIDAVCLGAVVVAALAGAVQGALPHLAHLAGAGAGWLGARVLGPLLAPRLATVLPAFAAHPVAAALAFGGCALAGSLLAGALFRLLGGGDGPRGGADRGLGALLGAAHASLALWVLLSALAAWGKPVRLGSVRLDPRRSDLTGLARDHSALAAVGPALDALQR